MWVGSPAGESQDWVRAGRFTSLTQAPQEQGHKAQSRLV